MRISKLFMILFIGILIIIPLACKDKPAEMEKAEQSEGEEAGTRLAVTDTYDTVRKGVRLILTYDSSISTFLGTVENVTEVPIKSARVEVHLSNGIELGPTEKVDLKPGDKIEVKLAAENQTFEWWKAHAEAGEGEHESGHEGEHKHKHGEEHEHGGQH